MPDPRIEEPKEEAPKEEAPKEEAPKEEAPKEEAPKEEAPKEGDFKIPDEHKEKGWAKKVKNQEDVYSQLNTMEEMIGKKSAPFDYEKATENEIKEHLASARPKDIDGYAWGEEGKVSAEDKEFFGNMLLEGGIDAYKGNKLIEKYLKKQDDVRSSMFDKEGFTKVLEESFKGEGDFKKIAGETATLLKGNLNEDDAKMLESMPNKFLGMVYRLTNNLKKAYGAEIDRDPGSPGGHGAPDVKGVRSEIRKQIIELSKKPHTAAEKKVLQDKLDATYK